MEVENQVSFISPMLQNTQFGNVDDETTIPFKKIPTRQLQKTQKTQAE